MADTNFDPSLRYVLIDEGGNDDDPHDHGGRTSRGITQREFDSWCKLNGKDSGDVWEATSDQISQIYRTQYWDPYCDKLPSGVDYVFFDTAVNAGRSQAVKSFQKALGVNVDGMMGQVTLAAIQDAEPTKLIHDVCDTRRTFYKHLRQFPRYGKGWLSRVDHCEHSALSMTSTKFSEPNTASPVDPTPKADSTDVATTTVSPETSGATTVAAGGFLSVLQSFKDSISTYTGDIQYLKYVLVGIAIVSLSYSLYGFAHRSKVQAAV